MLLVALVVSLVLFAPFCASEPVHVPIIRRGGRPAAAERSKGSYTRVRRATSEEIPITNENTDFSYYAAISIGTPPQTFNVLLGTASGDLWTVATGCTSGCPSVLYDPSKSSTATNDSTATTVKYGIGSVEGFIFTDVIRMGSYSALVRFVVGEKISDNLVSDPISGVMGLGFGGLASTPIASVTFWQSIFASDPSATAEMGFWLSRVRGTSNPAKEEPGGAFTFGGVNAPMYSGDIEYLPVAGDASKFWSLNVTAMTVQGNAISVTGSTNLAAFDVGTTHIGGPAADVQAIWAAVPGSSKLDNTNGYYQFPCATQMNVAVAFGGTQWAISPVDMNIGPVSDGSNMCLGGIFEISLSNPWWIFGDTFMKNVYTALRQNPPAVGFAQLSTVAGGTGLSHYFHIDP
ncbi:aspartyl protease [Mycena crocata]|nr:aspartyl protease [Mycena crocata]